MTAKPESGLRARIAKALRARGCLVLTQHGGGFSGAGRSDLLACCGGRFTAIEVKTVSGSPTLLQKHFLRTVRAAGGIAFLARSSGAAIGVLDAWENIMAKKKTDALEADDLLAGLDAAASSADDEWDDLFTDNASPQGDTLSEYERNTRVLNIDDAPNPVVDPDWQFDAHGPAYDVPPDGASFPLIANIEPHTSPVDALFDSAELGAAGLDLSPEGAVLWAGICRIDARLTKLADALAEAIQHMVTLSSAAEAPKKRASRKPAAE